MEFYSELPYEDFSYYNTPSTHEVGGSILTGIIIVTVIVIVFFTVYNAVYSVLRILVNRQIYEKFTTPGMAVAHAVLGVLLPLYESICLFVMRNRPYNPGKEPDLGTPFMTTPPPIAPAPEMPRQTSEEAPAAPAPKQEETPAEDQNTADPVDGEFKKVDEEIIPGEYRRVEESPRPEHEQMTSSYTYGGTKEEPKTDDKPSAEE